MTGEKRLTLGQASLLLGVCETTLRHWTDEGMVKAFITPGGHRRYEEADLDAFLRSHHKAQGVKGLVARIEERALQQGMARQYFLARPWYGALGEEQRLQFRERGRRLVELLVLHITHPSRREALLEEARALGEEYGRHLGGLGLPLPEALEVFTLYRSGIVDSALEVLRDRQPVNRRALEAFPRVIGLMDRVLLSLVEAYQKEVP
ncbi:MAG TPA: helix-turn-helix domain-containing protein [Dehalococcoidia bacterium]|nr:helix-turn-helix domain-containing protein [Dehalococcoidia bacterium]